MKRKDRFGITIPGKVIYFEEFETDWHHIIEQMLAEKQSESPAKAG
jgi:hypothetical protein